MNQIVCTENRVTIFDQEPGNSVAFYHRLGGELIIEATGIGFSATPARLRALSHHLWALADHAEKAAKKTAPAASERGAS